MKNFLFTVFLFALSSTALVMAQLREGGEINQTVTQNTRISGKKAQLQPDSMQIYFFGGPAGEIDPQPYQTNIFSYDTDGKMVEKVIHVNGYPSSRELYFFSATNAATHTYYWNDSTSAWVLETKTSRYFDAVGKDTAELSYQFDENGDSAHLSGSITSTTYDGFGRLTQLVYKTFLGNPNTWVTNGREIFNYHGNEALPYESFYQLTDNNNNWQDSYHYLYPNPGVREKLIFDGSGWYKATYDSSVITNRTQSYYSSEYNDNLQVYELVKSEHRTLDQHGSVIVDLVIGYQNNIADTLTNTLDTFQYGSGGEMLLHTEYFESYPIFREIFFYHHNASFLRRVPASLLQVFPNPVVSGESLIISVLDDVTVSAYDSKGVLVKTWKSDGMQHLSTEGLTPGVYFLRSSGSATTYTGRLVVR